MAFNLLTEAQATKKLLISKSTLRLWRSKLLGPKFIKIGKVVRYVEEDIDSFITKNKIETSDCGCGGDATYKKKVAV